MQDFIILYQDEYKNLSTEGVESQAMIFLFTKIYRYARMYWNIKRFPYSTLLWT